MLTVIAVVLLLGLALLSVVLRKTYAMVRPQELQRQAAAGNQLAKRLYRAVGYGVSLPVLLWLVLALASAAGFVVLALNAPVWLSVIVIAGMLWLSFSWLPSTRVSGLSIRLTQWATPAVDRTLHYLDLPFNRLAGWLGRHYLPKHSGLYELQDLLDLLDLQSRQPDSRITGEEIDLIRRVLQFGDHKVRDVLRPRSKVKSVAASDPIGPVLLDELHASGQTSFPVKKAAHSKEIIGSLQLGDIGIHSRGTVEDHMTSGTNYIGEADSLAEALHQFYQTKQQLFIVVDDDEEYLGVLTLENILHILLGQPAAAAAMEGEESLPQSEQTVVE